MSDEREKYDRYRNTILEFCEPPGGRVDLRRPLDAAALATLRAQGLDGAFAVLTAENPEGENAEDEPSETEEARQARANARRTATLVERLTEAGTAFRRVDGVAPDGEYRERCVAVRLPLERAVALAKSADQLALFWYDGAAFWLVPAEADQPPRPLAGSA